MYRHCCPTYILLVELKPEEESLGVFLDGRNLAAPRAHTLLLNHKTTQNNDGLGLVLSVSGGCFIYSWGPGCNP